MTRAKNAATRQRRAKGSGSLVRQKDGTWRYQATINGRRMSIKIDAPNATAANKLVPGAAEALAQRAERVRVAATDPDRAERQTWTVAQYAEHYLREVESYLSPTTYERYQQVVNRHLIPLIGTRRMSEVTPRDVKRLREQLTGDGMRYVGVRAKKGTASSARPRGRLSEATVTKITNVLSAIFTFAIEDEEDFTSNPVRRHRAKRGATAPGTVQEGRRAPQAMTLEEVAAFVALAHDEEPDIYVAVLLSARLGLRRGEALGLKWGDVDLEEGRVWVRRSMYQVPGEAPGEKETKTNKVRAIQIDADYVADLRAIREAQTVHRLNADYVAARPDGSALSPMGYAGRFRAMAKRHRLKVHPHLLRHSWVSQLIALGYDAVTIASMSGHSPDMLLKVYAHAFDARKREAMDAYGAAWRAAAGA